MLIKEVPEALYMLFHLIFKPKEVDTIVPAWVAVNLLQNFNFKEKKVFLPELNFEWINTGFMNMSDINNIRSHKKEIK